VRVIFSETAWRDYLHWSEQDQKVLAVVNRLIEDVRRHPFTGLGKPEPLRRELAGYWSRRITAEHRLVYRVQGKGADQEVAIARCRYHY
jgi:toxin YoeB